MANNNKINLDVFFPNFYGEEGVALTMSSILTHTANDRVDVRANVIAKGRGFAPEFIRPLMHRRLYGRVAHWMKHPLEWMFLCSRRHLRRGDIAYMWLESPEHISQYFRDRGVLVVREMINCTNARRRAEFEKAYAALGDPQGARRACPDESIEVERRHVMSADFVFCPNNFVKQSVTEYGFPAERCIDTSYGWSETRLSGTSRVMPNDGVFRVAFVGTIDVRKGAPILLEAWAKAKIDGQLLLAGRMYDEVERKYGDVLRRSDVICLGHVDDIGAVYRSAWVFCLPTWEEGGPQVTLEAMSQGLATVVTPMGTAGAFDENEDVGVVVPPGDVNALVEALRRLKEDETYRARLQDASRERAQRFTWERVAAQRRTALLQAHAAWFDGRTAPTQMPASRIDSAAS